MGMHVVRFVCIGLGNGGVQVSWGGCIMCSFILIRDYKGLEEYIIHCFGISFRGR